MTHYDDAASDASDDAASDNNTIDSNLNISFNRP